MHVPSYPRVVALLAVLASFAGGAQAVEFDEKLKAPLMKDPVALRSQAESYVAKFTALRAAGPRELISNRALAAQRFDLTWQIQQAIDTRKSLGDLTELGIKPRGDGSFHIDYDANPQWERPEERFAVLPAGTDWQGLGEQLISRGFREVDVEKLKEYVSTHDLQKDSSRETLPLTLSFSKIVKKYDKIKRPVEDAAVLSYIYQRERIRSEMGRAWAEGLLNSLDAQRGRILLAFFGEMKSTGVWGPSDQRAGIDEQVRLMRLPDFEQLVTAEVMGDAP
jgi:hypothetical protein